jgi:acetolactate synthase-1/3 small subunit
MTKFTIAVLVRNQFGVLNRFTSMFRRRGFNISTLTVSETESPDYSRITVSFIGQESTKQQFIDQLYKLPDVKSIKELNSDETVSAELLLIKMANDPATRDDIRDAANAFSARTVDYTKDSMMLQLTDTSRRIDEFIDLMRDYQILEICRTGIVALERGSSTILKNENN